VIAIGIVLIYKATGVVNFAQGEIVMVCMFIAWTLVTRLKLLAVAAAITLVCAAILGFVLERVFIHPFLSAPFTVTAITTPGAVPRARLDGDQHLGTEAYNFPRSSPMSCFAWASSPFPLSDVVIVVVTGILVLMLYVFFGKTKFGVAMRGTRTTLAARPSASTSGTSFDDLVVAAVVATVGGILVAPVTWPSYAMMLPYLMKPSRGRSSAASRACPAPWWGFSRRRREPRRYVSSDMKGVLAFLLIVVFLLFRPTGLFGKPAATRV
jgi:branched-chain amino acid transport system permease protein